MLEIERMWEIFTVYESCVLEMRAISPYGERPVCRVFKADDYSSLDDFKNAFVNAALLLNQQKRNVYIMMNPIKSDFAAQSAGDVDIASRRLLLVDIDRKRKANCPASDSELGIAHATAVQIADFTVQLGLPNPVMVMSGNGYRLY